MRLQKKVKKGKITKQHAKQVLTTNKIEIKSKNENQSVKAFVLNALFVICLIGYEAQVPFFVEPEAAEGRARGVMLPLFFRPFTTIF